MALTDEVILKDIAGFEERIAATRVKLVKLNGQELTDWKERKRLKAKRCEFEGEIVHVNNLIAIARSALDASEGQGQP